MARFDVFQYASKQVPFLVEVQADLLGDLKSTVVVPLVPGEAVGDKRLTKLHPEISIDGKPYIFMTTDIGTIPRNTLGEFQKNLEDDYRETIVDALDFLFQGY